MISSVPTNNAMNYVHDLDSRQVPNYMWIFMFPYFDI